jgi:hypothetical protein
MGDGEKPPRAVHAERRSSFATTPSGRAPTTALWSVHPIAFTPKILDMVVPYCLCPGAAAPTAAPTAHPPSRRHHTLRANRAGEPALY